MPTTFEIHPAVGIARLGRSDAFFVGPEPDLPRPTSYRSNGDLLRQAARFRIFRCDRDSNGALTATQEITATDAQISWSVHLVNRKGASDQFLAPGPRNATVTDRSQLVIDPGVQQLTAPNQAAKFDGGAFLGRPVPLGEVRTEANGRLLVLGASGESASVTPTGVPKPIDTFADNDTWHDNTSDGPVSAHLKLADGTEVDAVTAWCIVAPPDFAPETMNFRTLYDVAFDIAVQRGWRSVPIKPTFTLDIQPILARAVGYQWVNGGTVDGTPIVRGAASGHGGQHPGDFANIWPRLADPTTPASVRRNILRRLQDPNVNPSTNPLPAAQRMPRLHDENNNELVLTATHSQYAVLQAWVNGTFVNDLAAPTPRAELMPDALDRVAMEACSGGAFFPGIETNGDVVSNSANYSEAFRLDASRLIPGQVTARNAVPWQADFLLCRWEPQAQLGWWPAQRPDHVIAESSLQTVPFDTTKRVLWERGVNEFTDMVEHWHELGIVVSRQGPDGTTVFVETERTLADTALHPFIAASRLGPVPQV